MYFVASISSFWLSLKYPIPRLQRAQRSPLIFPVSSRSFYFGELDFNEWTKTRGTRAFYLGDLLDVPVNSLARHAKRTADVVVRINLASERIDAPLHGQDCLALFLVRFVFAHLT